MATTDFEEFFEAFKASDTGMLLIEKDYSSVAVDFLDNKARTLNYYKSEGFLPERAKKSNFSFIDLVWLRIVFQLREMGITRELIKKLREHAFEPVDQTEYAEVLKNNESVVRTGLAEILKMVPEEHHREITLRVEKAFKEGSLGKELVQNKFIAFLTYLVEKKVPGEIHLYADGTIEYNTLNSDSLPMFYFVHKTYVSISVTEILSYYLSKDFISASIQEIYFSKDELLILQTVRKEKCKSIKINYRDEQIDLIELEKEINIDKAKRISEVFLANAYEDVTIKTQKGQIISCKKTTKIKPPKVVK